MHTLPSSTLFPLHDALPISGNQQPLTIRWPSVEGKHYVIERSATLFGDTWSPVSTIGGNWAPSVAEQDRKSTRLNSSHLGISYAVFCLKKKKKKNETQASHH